MEKVEKIGNENSIKTEDLDIICRICLQRTDDRINLFSPLERDIIVASAVMDCAPIQIIFGDNLPSTICQKCVVQLDIAYRFRTLCVQSDETLRQIISQANIKQEKSDDIEDVGHFDDAVSEIKDEIDAYSSEDDKFLVDLLDSKINKDSLLSTSSSKQHFTCLKCLTVFKRKYHLQRHQKLCASDKIKRRKKKKLKEEPELVTHDERTPIKFKLKPYSIFKENIQRDANGRWACGICHKTYKSKYHTARHAIVHSDFRFDCPHCDKTFVRPSSLREHVNIHTGQRSYNCEFCGKIFRTDSAFNTHRRIHLGVRPYKCEICTRSFTQNKTLKNHMRTHTGERPFVCETCGRSFNRKHILKTHTMIHTGERPHRCDICDRTFICKQHLQLHMVKHTGEPASSFRCSVCDKRFNTHQLKLKHELDAHNLTFNNTF